MTAATVVDALVAEQIMAAIAHGMTIREFVDGMMGKQYVPDARVCTRPALRRYVEANPEWAKRMRRALHDAQRSKETEKGKWNRSKKRCKRGHEFDLVYSNGPHVSRRCSKCFKINNARLYYRKKAEREYAAKLDASVRSSRAAGKLSAHRITRAEEQA